MVCNNELQHEQPAARRQWGTVWPPPDGVSPVTGTKGGGEKGGGESGGVHDFTVGALAVLVGASHARCHRVHLTGPHGSPRFPLYATASEGRGPDSGTGQMLAVSLFSLMEESLQ